MQGPSVQFSKSSCRRLCRWLLLIQPPRIAAFFKLLDRVIGDCKLLRFSQPFLQASDDLAGAPQGESNRVSEDFSFRHTGVEHKENENARCLYRPRPSPPKASTRTLRTANGCCC